MDRDLIVAHAVIWPTLYLGWRYGMAFLWDVGIQSNLLVVFGLAWFVVSMIIGGLAADYIGLDKRKREKRLKGLM